MQLTLRATDDVERCELSDRADREDCVMSALSYYHLDGYWLCGRNISPENQIYQITISLGKVLLPAAL